MLKFTKSALVVFLGFVFIFSAVAKMVPLEFFEFQIAEIVDTRWRTVQLIARLIIAFEFALGILLIVHLELRRITIPTVLALLSFFTILLIYQYIRHGNQENCGCFGDQVRMSTSAGILKNVVLIVIAVVIWYLEPQWEWSVGKWRRSVPLIVIGLMMIPWFMMKPIEWKSVTERTPIKKILNYDKLYDSSYVNKKPSFDYHHGKHIIMFVDPHCGHCKLATAKASIMKEKNNHLPFLVVIGGAKDDMDEFVEVTHALNLEKVHFNEARSFMQLAGKGGFPSINWVNEGLLDYHTVHFELLQEDIEKWLKSEN